MSVTAVVVHYRNTDDTRACLASLIAAGDVDVILVDNSGRREGVELVRAEFPPVRTPVRTIDAGTNAGFAAGCNAGIRSALRTGASHVLLLNTDAEVRPGYLAPMLETAGQPGVGLVAGIVLLPAAPGEPQRVWAAGGHYDRWRSTGVNIGEGQLDDALYRAPRDLDYASGCFVLIRREVFDAVGLFDERFFLYMEDLEFCQRAAKGGFRTRYEPRAECVHKAHRAGGGSFGDPGDATLYYSTRSRLLYARRHMTGLERGAALGFMVITRAVLAAQAARRGRFRRAHLLLAATRDGLLGRGGSSMPDASP